MENDTRHPAFIPPEEKPPTAFEYPTGRALNAHGETLRTGPGRTERTVEKRPARQQ